ncbi:flagellar hook-associated protein FlgK [Anaerocolumna aminovalerica]|uniref:flagellar hook-associated protein FlgK n=1 Tax=Anaerocolumna aminovalerica TaxID=1527 RepID=UPI00248C7F42|nr:flagellar hook-associated protein FlgK [Anaerocolumna aminovalerica]
MPSTFFGLNIGKSGLYTYQAALNTTYHNISNIETKGYCRQIINQQAGVPLRVNNTYGMVGSGVDVISITQERNAYYDLKYWKNNTMYGEYAAKEHYMTEIENYFNEVALKGFTTSFNTFHDSLQELSKDPSSPSVRKQVTNFAKNLTEYFNSLSTSMKQIQENCNFEIKNQVDRINSLAKQISTLTKQINTLEVNGGFANDLRDQRALLVDELSEIANISVTEKTVGDGIGITSYVVKLDHQTLVDTNNYRTLKVVPRKSDEKANQNDIEGLYDIQWEDGQRFNVRSASLGGYLQSLFEVRDGNNLGNLQGKANGTKGDTTVTLSGTNINDVEKLSIPEKGIITIGNHEYKYNSFDFTVDADGKYVYTFNLDSPLAADANNEKTHIGDSVNYKGIPYYMGQLNEFVRTYSRAYNDIHRSGQDANGDPGLDFFNGYDKVTGNNFDFSDPAVGFKEYYKVTAANFTVTDVIYSDPSKVVTATDITNGVEENDIVEKLIALKENKSLFKQGAPASFLQTLVAEIGIDTDKAKSFAASQTNILSMITNQRLSVSGVDMDEEGMNLIRYQSAYNLSAKAISVMDEIYNKLINEMAV